MYAVFVRTIFNTTQKGDTMKNSRKQTTWMKNVKQRRGYVNWTCWINHVDCRHGEKIGKNTHHQHKRTIDMEKGLCKNVVTLLIVNINHRILYIINRKSNDDFI